MFHEIFSAGRWYWESGFLSSVYHCLLESFALSIQSLWNAAELDCSRRQSSILLQWREEFLVDCDVLWDLQLDQVHSEVRGGLDSLLQLAILCRFHLSLGKGCSRRIEEDMFSTDLPISSAELQWHHVQEVDLARVVLEYLAFWGQLDACWEIKTCFSSFGRIFGGCWEMLGDVEGCWGMLRYVLPRFRIFPHVSGCFVMFRHVSSRFRMFLHISGRFVTFRGVSSRLGMLRNFEGCWGMFDDNFLAKLSFLILFTFEYLSSDFCAL